MRDQGRWDEGSGVIKGGGMREVECEGGGVIKEGGVREVG